MTAKLRQWETFFSDFGKRVVPVFPYGVAWLFLRGLGLIYFAAFASMAMQVEGLLGSEGISPAAAWLADQQALMGGTRFWRLPTLFWFGTSDRALVAACYAGIGFSLLLVLNRWGQLAAAGCFLLYLSIANVGQQFTGFQWDALLLETGFLAVFLPGRSRWIVFLYRLLIGRFMLMSGVVKLASGDPAWRDLTALRFHFETQPLPSPLGYYAHFLPDWFQRASVGAVLAIELVVPFFVFLPRPWRLFAAGGFILLQAGIMLTGNFAFFNLLTVLLCLFLFEDRDFAKVMPIQWWRHVAAPGPAAGLWASRISGAWAMVVVLTLAGHLWLGMAHRFPGSLGLALLQGTSAFSVVNHYGPFAVMTRERLELVVEGSEDGKQWLEYGFRYKPDAPDKPLRWNIPHQPRLDWQFWFAALPHPLVRHDEWLASFLERLREGSPAVLSLLARNPFPDRPPAYIRAKLYRYTYTDPGKRSRTGHLWQREPADRAGSKR